MADFEIDFEDLSFEEIEEVETRTGKPIEDLIKRDAKDKSLPSAVELRALAYLITRRTDPDFTWEQAGKLKLKLLTDIAPEPAENRAARRARPTKAASKRT